MRGSDFFWFLLCSPITYTTAHIIPCFLDLVDGWQCVVTLDDNLPCHLVYIPWIQMMDKHNPMLLACYLVIYNWWNSLTFDFLFDFGSNTSEPQTDAQVRSQRNGGTLHRGTEIVHQPADGQSRVAASQQRLGRLALRSATLQTLQRQRVSHSINFFFQFNGFDLIYFFSRLFSTDKKNDLLIPLYRPLAAVVAWLLWQETKELVAQASVLGFKWFPFNTVTLSKLFV